MSAPTPAPRPAAPARSGGTGAAGAVRLVAAREITTRVRSKAFLWTTGLLLVAVVGGGLLLDLAGGGSEPSRVGLTPGTAALAGSLRAGGIEVVDLTGDAAARTAVTDGEVDAALTGEATDFTVLVDEQLDPALGQVLGALRQQVVLSGAITELGGDPAAVGQQLAEPLPVDAVSPPPERDGAQVVAGFVAGILLFIALQTGAQMVAQGVVEEKSSRVVELLLSTLRPWQLMAGKVIGVGVVVLIQVGVAVGLGLVDASTIDLGATAAWALVWFAVGFVMYALAIAALAALVSRQEDIGSVTAPLIFVMIIPYMIGVSIAPWDPTNSLVVWLSYIPFASPMIMPIRIALGTAETWQVLASLGLSLALIPLLVWGGGTIYSNAVLRTGARVKLRDALRSA